MEKLYKFKLIEIIDDTSDIKSFIFEPLDNDFKWQAGQYLDWQVPHQNADDRGERRWFTIASAPSEGKVMLSCRFSENGSTLKSHLLELQIGDELEAKGPSGSFTAESNSDQLVLIAGGIGITPFRSILKERAAKNTLDNIVLIYGNKSEDNVAFKSEIDELAGQHNGLALHYIYGEYINAQLINKLLGNLDNKKYMISGLEKMVAAIKQSLIDEGVSEDNIKIDDFGGYDWTIKEAVYQ